MIPRIFNAAQDEHSQRKIYKVNVLFTAATWLGNDCNRVCRGHKQVFSADTFWPLVTLPTHNDTLELARRSPLCIVQGLRSHQMTVGPELRCSVFLFFSLPVHLFSLAGIGQQSRPSCPVMEHTIATPLWTQREINDILISNIPHFGASLSSC